MTPPLTLIDHPFYLAGRWERSPQTYDVLSPYDGTVIGSTSHATEAQLEEAIAKATEAFQRTRKLPSYVRSQILLDIAEGIARRKEDLARAMTLEAGKPIKDSRAEVDRSLLTFRTAAEEAHRIGGELMPLDFIPKAEGRIGITRRVPLGPILGITPFNFPLNLVAHKVAPAIAAGNTIVVKVAAKTPLTMLIACEIMEATALPKGALSVLTVDPSLHERLVTDERFKALSFTGSAAVGWQLKAKAGKKKVTLELGGNAGVIVDRDADLDWSVRRVAYGGFTFAGQSCISVQRCFVHEAIFESWTRRFLDAVKQIRLGDPMDPNTDLGPMIEPKVVTRTHAWVEEALRDGATVLAGGKARGNLFEPTVLTNVAPTSPICRQEVFAPLVILFPFRDVRDAVAAVNDSAYGLQAGIFTNSLSHAWYAFDELEVGGVLINDIPTWRIDPMPYGGVKDSGVGREGVKYAIEEMTELRLMVVNPLHQAGAGPVGAGGS